MLLQEPTHWFVPANLQRPVPSAGDMVGDIDIFVCLKEDAAIALISICG